MYSIPTSTYSLFTNLDTVSLQYIFIVFNIQYPWNTYSLFTNKQYPYNAYGLQCIFIAYEQTASLQYKFFI